MKLSYKDRLVIPLLLPEKSSLMGQLTAREIKNKIEFSKEEKEAANFKVEGGNVYWDKEAAEEVELEFNNDQLSLLVKQIELLDEAEQIPEGWLDVCQKILKHQKEK